MGPLLSLPEPVIWVIHEQLDDKVHAVRGNVGDELCNACAVLPVKEAGRAQKGEHRHQRMEEGRDRWVSESSLAHDIAGSRVGVSPTLVLARLWDRQRKRVDASHHTGLLLFGWIRRTIRDRFKQELYSCM